MLQFSFLPDTWSFIHLLTVTGLIHSLLPKAVRGLIAGEIRSLEKEHAKKNKMDG